MKIEPITVTTLNRYVKAISIIRENVPCKK